MSKLSKWIRNRRKSKNAGDSTTAAYPKFFSESDIEICERVKPFTMTDPLRVFTLLRSVEHVVQNQVEGVFIECGVWKGGSSMAMALKLLECDVGDRPIHMFDTYKGMAAPTAEDKDYKNVDADVEFQNKKFQDADSSDWCYSPLDEVKENMKSTGYAEDNVKFVEGKVEDTLLDYEVDKIALLRLDTDWYKSTQAEMEHLFPKLSKGGILILDDYYYWQGAKKAVDEYVKDQEVELFLAPIGAGGGVVGVKQ